MCFVLLGHISKLNYNSHTSSHTEPQKHISHPLGAIHMESKTIGLMWYHTHFRNFNQTDSITLAPFLKSLIKFQCHPRKDNLKNGNTNCSCWPLYYVYKSSTCYIFGFDKKDSTQLFAART